MTRLWSEDRYWTEALDRYVQAREAGSRKIVIDMDAVEAVIYDGDGPGYRVMEAMCSVQEHEGWEGCRGAPRVALALLQLLSELPSGAQSSSN